MIRLRPLIDDRVGKPTYAEQRRYPTHAFRMPETYVTAGTQTVIEIFRGLAPGRIVKIYQDVAAKNQVEIAIPHHILRIDQIGTGEFDGAPEPFGDLMIGVGDGLEIT